MERTTNPWIKNSNAKWCFYGLILHCCWWKTGRTEYSVWRRVPRPYHWRRSSAKPYVTLLWRTALQFLYGLHLFEYDTNLVGGKNVWIRPWFIQIEWLSADFGNSMAQRPDVGCRIVEVGEAMEACLQFQGASLLCKDIITTSGGKLPQGWQVERPGLSESKCLFALYLELFPTRKSSWKLER